MLAVIHSLAMYDYGSKVVPNKIKFQIIKVLNGSAMWTGLTNNSFHKVDRIHMHGMFFIYIEENFNMHGLSRHGSTPIGQLTLVFLNASWAYRTVDKELTCPWNLALSRGIVSDCAWGVGGSYPPKTLYSINFRTYLVMGRKLLPPLPSSVLTPLISSWLAQ